MRAWVIDSEKEKAMGEIQRNSTDHRKGSPERQKPTEQERNRNGTSQGAGGKGPPECWTWGCEGPVPRGDTPVLREAGSAPAKETLLPTCKNCSRDQLVQHTRPDRKNQSQHTGG